MAEQRKKCVQCHRLKAQTEFTGRYNKCKECRAFNARDQRVKAKAAAEKELAAIKLQQAEGVEPDALLKSVDDLEEYAARVNEDAPVRLSAGLAGLRQAAILIRQEESSGISMWNQMHKQCLDTLHNTYGSQTMDVADRVWMRIEEAADEAAEKGW